MIPEHLVLNSEKILYLLSLENGELHTRILAESINATHDGVKALARALLGDGLIIRAGFYTGHVKATKKGRSANNINILRGKPNRVNQIFIIKTLMKTGLISHDELTKLVYEPKLVDEKINSFEARNSFNSMVTRGVIDRVLVNRVTHYCVNDHSEFALRELLMPRKYCRKEAKEEKVITVSKKRAVNMNSFNLIMSASN